jgi:hypothetical protein
MSLTVRQQLSAHRSEPKTIQSVGHLRQNLFSANVLVALIWLWNGWASELKYTRRVSQKFATANPQPTNGRSTRRSSCITVKEQPKGDAAFSSQHVTSNQRNEKRKRKEVSQRVELRHQVSCNTPPEQGGVVSKPSLN